MADGVGRENSNSDGCQTAQSFPAQQSSQAFDGGFAGSPWRPKECDADISGRTAVIRPCGIQREAAGVASRVSTERWRKVAMVDRGNVDKHRQSYCGMKGVVEEEKW